MPLIILLTDNATTETCTLSLHDALPIFSESLFRPGAEKYLRDNGSYGLTTLRKRHLHLAGDRAVFSYAGKRSEEHTSELQSQFHLVCRLLLEKKNLKATDCPACTAVRPT